MGGYVKSGVNYGLKTGINTAMGKAISNSYKEIVDPDMTYIRKFKSVPKPLTVASKLTKVGIASIAVTSLNGVYNFSHYNMKKAAALTTLDLVATFSTIAISVFLPGVGTVLALGIGLGIGYIAGKGKEYVQKEW